MSSAGAVNVSLDYADAYMEVIGMFIRRIDSDDIESNIVLRSWVRGPFETNQLIWSETTGDGCVVAWQLLQSKNRSGNYSEERKETLLLDC